MKAFVDKIREDLLEGLNNDVHNASHYRDWIDQLDYIVETAKKYRNAQYYSQIKEIAIRDELWEEEEFEDWMLDKYKEFRGIRSLKR